MSEKHYLISEASRKVCVEAHVLRYWEEELGLVIPRNELGHRYYTEELIHTFQNIKKLKEQGYQLKAVRALLPKLLEGEQTDELALPAELTPASAEEREVALREEKMNQFQFLMQEIMEQALERKAETLSGALGRGVSQEISTQVSERLLKEMDYQMREREEREEARYQQLDETIRSIQRGRAEAAAAKVIPIRDGKQKKKLFGRKKEKKA